MDSFPNRAGVYELVLGDRQRITLAVPEAITTSKPLPLILALHYGGPVTPFYGRGILVGLVEPALHTLEAMFVAPDCLHGDWTNSESEKAILDLLQSLQAHYNIDIDKTLITGYSLGGAGTWYIAARNQDKFTAALPMAGWPQPDTADVNWSIPLYVIHSRHDEIVPFNQSKEVVRVLKDKGASIEFVPLDGITHYETHRFILPLQEAIPWVRNTWGRINKETIIK